MVFCQLILVPIFKIASSQESVKNDQGLNLMVWSGSLLAFTLKEAPAFFLYDRSKKHCKKREIRHRLYSLEAIKAS
jgi:hypothetical protein